MKNIPGAYDRDYIVVVDDHKMDREVVRLAVGASHWDARVIDFPGGREFIEFVDASGMLDIPPPKLVLVDLNMPQMDGFRVCQELETMRRWDQSVTVCIISSVLQPVQKRQLDSLSVPGVRKFEGYQGGVGFMNDLATTRELTAVLRKYPIPVQGLANNPTQTGPADVN